MYVAYTDAGVKGLNSYHSYCLFDENNNLVKGEVLESNIMHSDKAEEYSLKLLMDYIEEHKLDNVKVHTDCISMIDRFKFKLEEFRNKSLNVTIQWVRREFNKLADLACSYGNSEFYKKSKLVVIWSKIMNFEKPEVLTKNNLNHKLSDKLKNYTINLYRRITKDNSITVFDILEWAKGRLTARSKNGIRFLVREFIEFKFMTSKAEKEQYKLVKDVNNISEEYRYIKLNEKAYQEYITITKKNKNLTSKQARLKLYRNIKLAKLVFESKNKNLKIYQYGYIKIHVSKNTIIKVETCNFTPKGWFINREVYDKINTALCINF